MGPTADVLVIGAGVSGLTTALCLAEQGVSVTVRTERLPAETTSCAAGAIWGPYLLTEARELRWSEQTRLELESLARHTEAGVRLVSGYEAARAVVARPSWSSQLHDFRMCSADELPPGYHGGWWYTAPVVDMPVYLRYLRQRLTGAGVAVEKGEVNSLAAAVGEYRIVVNCTGVGARRLTGDRRLTPIRGQLVVVENPGISTFFAEYDDSPRPAYFLPHGDRVVLGGSADPGRDDLAPDEAISADIRRRCAAIEPSLGTARVIEYRVGLRPIRHRIRVERERLATGYVVHNYGHGGAGVTVSWGCARAVTRLVTEALATQAPATDALATEA